MSTIEERLETYWWNAFDFGLANAAAGPLDSGGTIITDWNDALWALRKLSGNLFSNSELDAIIARMEGNSPSRDEAMVEDSPPHNEVSDEYRERVVENDHHGKMLEDKHYERDDIYKK